MKKIFKPNVDYEADIIMIGISCHLKDYRIVHFLNKDYHLDLVRYDDLLVYKEYDKELEKNLPQNFPFYYYKSAEDYIDYNFIINFTNNGYLINEYKGMDYILIIKGAVDNYDSKPIIDCLKQIPNVLTVAELKTNTIKNIKPIIEDLEVHVLEHNKKEKEIEKVKEIIIKK